MTEAETQLSDVGQRIYSSLERFNAAVDGLAQLFLRIEPEAHKLEQARHDIQGLAEEVLGSDHVEAFMLVWGKALWKDIKSSGSAELRQALKVDSYSPDSLGLGVQEGPVASAPSEGEEDHDIVPTESEDDDSVAVAPGFPPELAYELFGLAMGSMQARDVLDFILPLGLVSEYLMAVHRRFLRPHDSYVLANSVTAMIVSAFESHVVATLRAYMTYHERIVLSLRTEGQHEAKAYTIEDILNYESLDDFLEAAIDDRIEQFMRGSFEKWAAWWKSTLDGDWKIFAVDWEAAQELIQRRHVIMHNGGLVSSRYIRNVPKQYKDAEVGTPLPMSKSYVLSAIENMTSIGLLSSYNLWLKLGADEPDTIAALMLDKSYTLLVARQYGAARCVASIGAEIRCPDKTRMRLWVNALIARKELEGVEAIESEVATWDESAAGIVLRVAKAALLDEFDTLAELIPRAIQADELAWATVRTWPLFRTLREQPLYIELLQQYEESEPPDEGSDGPDADTNGPGADEPPEAS